MRTNDKCAFSAERFGWQPQRKIKTEKTIHKDIYFTLIWSYKVLCFGTRATVEPLLASSAEVEQGQCRYLQHSRNVEG